MSTESDQQRLDQLCTSCRDIIRQEVGQIVQDPETAEEITQIIFQDAVKDVRIIVGDGTIPSYFYDPNYIRGYVHAKTFAHLEQQGKISTLQQTYTDTSPEELSDCLDPLETHLQSEKEAEAIEDWSDTPRE